MSLSHSRSASRHRGAECRARAPRACCADNTTDSAAGAVEGELVTVTTSPITRRPCSECQAARKPSLKPAVERWVLQYDSVRPLEARIAAPRLLHDRLLIVDHKVAWVLTQSMNAFAHDRVLSRFSFFDLTRSPGGRRSIIRACREARPKCRHRRVSYDAARLTHPTRSRRNILPRRTRDRAAPRRRPPRR